MQTFLPYPNFADSASVLDRQRLGKQRVETLQIMQTLVGFRLVTTEIIFTGVYDTIYYNANGYEVAEDDLRIDELYQTAIEEQQKKIDLPQNEWYVEEQESRGWSNHPAALMWRGFERSLLSYQQAMCAEWVEGRGFKDTCYDKTKALYEMTMGSTRGRRREPPWLGDEAFHISHQSNLIRKDPQFYAPQFPGVPDDLPYIWPTGG